MHNESVHTQHFEIFKWRQPRDLKVIEGLKPPQPLPLKNDYHTIKILKKKYIHKCNIHEVKSLKVFLPLEKIVSDREQQQRSNV